MRQLRQTLRLHLEAHLSLRECARVLGISKTKVGAIIGMARAAGVDWAVAQVLKDDELEARVYRAAVPRSSRHLEPDFALIHQELSTKHRLRRRVAHPGAARQRGQHGRLHGHRGHLRYDQPRHSHALHTVRDQHETGVRDR